MRGKVQIELPAARIAEFCRRHHVRQLALFGSVLREDFRDDSDIDVLVDFAPEARPNVFDLAAMQAELKEILGRDVDLVDRRIIEASDNYIRRRHILETAEVIYGA